MVFSSSLWLHDAKLFIEHPFWWKWEMQIRFLIYFLSTISIFGQDYEINILIFDENFDFWISFRDKNVHFWRKFQFWTIFRDKNFCFIEKHWIFWPRFPFFYKFLVITKIVCFKISILRKFRYLQDAILEIKFNFSKNFNYWPKFQLFAKFLTTKFDLWKYLSSVKYTIF